MRPEQRQRRGRGEVSSLTGEVSEATGEMVAFFLRAVEIHRRGLAGGKGSEFHFWRVPLGQKCTRPRE